MLGSGPLVLHLDPSTVIRSQLFKASDHMVISILEKEVMYKNIRATMLSQNKTSIPTACPLMVAENGYLRAEELAEHIRYLPGSLPAANHFRIRDFLCQTSFYLFSHPQLISLS